MGLLSFQTALTFTHPATQRHTVERKQVGICKVGAVTAFAAAKYIVTTLPQYAVLSFVVGTADVTQIHPTRRHGIGPDL